MVHKLQYGYSLILKQVNPVLVLRHLWFKGFDYLQFIHTSTGDSVTIDVSGDVIKDDEIEFKRLMARQ